MWVAAGCVWLKHIVLMNRSMRCLRVLCNVHTHLNLVWNSAKKCHTILQILTPRAPRWCLKPSRTISILKPFKMHISPLAHGSRTHCTIVECVVVYLSVRFSLFVPHTQNMQWLCELWKFLCNQLNILTNTRSHDITILYCEFHSHRAHTMFMSYMRTARHFKSIIHNDCAHGRWCQNVWLQTHGSVIIFMRLIVEETKEKRKKKTNSSSRNMAGIVRVEH